MVRDVNEVVIVLSFDPSRIQNLSSGNPATYLNFTKYLLKKGIKVHLIGTQDGKQTFRHKNFTFTPILNGYKNWILYTLKLILVAPFLKIPKNAVIISPRPAYLLPFAIFKPKNPKVFESVYELGQALGATSSLVLSKLIMTIYGLIEKYLLKKMDLVIVSPRYKDSYIGKYPWMKHKIYETVHESVDLKFFRPMNKKNLRKKWKLSSSKKIILQVAGITRKKRAALLLKSFAILKKKIPNSQLVFLGYINDPKYKQHLDALAKKLSITSSIRFIEGGGLLPFSCIPEIINCADVLAVTSVAETGPLPPLEAFACGVPVVSTDVGLVPLLIRNDKLGKLLPVNTSGKNFAKALIEILNQKESQQLRKFRRKIAKSFSVEASQRKRLEACEIAKNNRLTALRRKNI